MKLGMFFSGNVLSQFSLKYGEVLGILPLPRPLFFGDVDHRVIIHKNI
jgi:hypothetical protein